MCFVGISVSLSYVRGSLRGHCGPLVANDASDCAVEV
ncbi:hypothetical protein B0G57_110157 [Trinickia symbiotica]|nr:hypothetical protein B0G57_110157 [Trinickia symbiotica]